MLTVNGVSVDYRTTRAVHEVDLVVAGDETLALLGRSGSGKTSLLLAIAGVVPTASGTISLDGTELDALPTHERGIGVVFQDFALFPHLTVAGNVAYGLKVADATDDIDREVAGALSRVGLDGYGKRRIDQLSGGQAQRVALARTLAPRPRALLLDEPLGSLDPALRSSVAADLARLLDEIDVPTVIVTHDTSEAFALGDRIAVLDAGRLAALGTPDAVWAEPGSEEVARILGHRGIVHSEVHNETGAVGGLPIPPGTPDGVHALLIMPGAARHDPAGIASRVISSDFRGPHWMTAVLVGDGQVEIETETRLTPGSTIPISIDPRGVLVVD
jgi:thiamine transport system ATP-binding protein